MRTTEENFVQIFERKNKFIEQIKQQTLQLDQLLSSKLLIRGISPPPWLYVPHLPSLHVNPNGIHIPNSQPAISCSSSYFPLCNSNHQHVNAHHNELPNGSFVEFRASNVGLDGGEEQSVLPQRAADDAVDAFDTVLEQDCSIASPHCQKHARSSGIFQGQAQSVVKIQRSKSRQRALEKRKSVKTDKSCLRDENHAITGAITGSGMALLHSDNLDVSEFLHAVENNSERSSVEEQTDDCGSKDKNGSFSFGVVTRSKSSGHQSKSVKEVFCGHSSSDVADDRDPTRVEFFGSTMQRSNNFTQLVEPPNRSYICNKKYRRVDQMCYEGKEKESSVLGGVKGSRSSNPEPDIVIESLKNNSVIGCGKEDEAAKSAKEPNHVSKIDELVRPSLSTVGGPIIEGRDGRAKLSFTYKHPDVVTTVGGWHRQSNSRKRSMQQQDSANAGINNEESGKMNSSSHKRFRISGQQPGSVKETENEGSLSSVANKIDARPGHVDVLLEQILRKRSMQQQDSAHVGTGNKKSDVVNSSRHKRYKISGQQPGSIEETKNEISPSIVNKTDSRLENVDVLSEPLKPPFTNKNCIVEAARQGDHGSKDGESNVSYRMQRSESLILPSDWLDQSRNQYANLPKSVGGEKEHLLSKEKEAMYSSRVTRSSSSAHQCRYVEAARNLINDESDRTGTLKSIGKPAHVSDPVNKCMEVFNASPHFIESHQVEEAKVEDCGTMENNSDASFRIMRARNSRLSSDSVNESLKDGSFSKNCKEDFVGEFIEEPGNVDELNKLIEEKVDDCPNKENDNIVYSGKLTRSRNSSKQPSFAKAILDRGTSYFANTLASSANESIKGSKKVNKSVKQLNLSPASNDNNGVREVEVGECKMNSKENNISASVTRSGISGVGLRKSLQDPDNLGDVKEKIEDTVTQCWSKKNCSSPSIGRMTRSRTSSKQLTSAKETLKDDSSNEFLKIRKEIVFGSSIEDPKIFGKLKESVEETVDRPWSGKRVSSVISGRITRSRTSCKQPTLVQEKRNIDDSFVVNDHTFSQLHGETTQASHGVHELMDLYDHPISNEVTGLELIDDERKENETISPCIRTTSKNSSLQPDHVNGIVKNPSFTSNGEQDVVNRSSGEPNNVTGLGELTGDSFSQTDMLLLEENDESTNPLLASIPIDLVTGNYDIVPVFESFVVNTDDQKRVSEDGICLEKLDFPDTTLSRASLIEQLCKSACLHTLTSHDSTAFRMHEEQSLYQPVPDKLLGSVGSRSILPMNEDGEQHTSVDFSCLNKDVGTSYSYSLPFSSLDSSRDGKKPCTSPVKKVWDSILSISGSSGKKKSLILDLPCIREENENADAVADTFQKEIDSDALNKSSRREPLADITEEVIDEVTNIARSSMDSVNTDFNFQGTSRKVQRKLTNQSGNGRGSSRVRDNQITSLGAKIKRSTGLLNGRPSRTEMMEKTSLRGDKSYSEKVSKHNNIVSNVTSFIPLIQQKQATKVAAGKRDIKVKALEAAEAAKRLAEKKENERKLRKEALKLERVRQEKENLRQLELEKKRKEEERKKKDAEMAARKRQREEEEERKEKERKRKRLDEAKKHLRGHEEKLGGAKRNIELKNSSVDAIAHLRSDLKNGAGKLRRVEEERGYQKGDLLPDKGPMTLGGSDGDASQSMVDDHLEVISTADVATNNENAVTKVVKEQTYQMSPYQPSDDEEDDDDVPNKKFIPSWASKSSLSKSVFSQQSIDPDVIFPSESFSMIGKVCLPRKLQQL